MSSQRHAASTSASPHDNNLFLDISNEAPLCGQRKRTAIIGSIFYCLLLSGYAALAVGAPWVFKSDHRLISQWLCTSDVVLLIVTGIFQQYMVYQVKKIRLQGYYIFSQKLKHVIRLPCATVSYGTAAMLLIMVWESHITILPIAMILRIIMVGEVMFAGCFMSVYIGNVQQYNRLETQPDVLKSLYSPLQPSSSLQGLRYYDGGRLSDQQMALLQYQQENLSFLSQEILRLQESLSKYERSGMASQVDAGHLLAARDEELQTLTAEMNQVQCELRLARSLIADRDSEIQSIHTTNNQYVEENDRLRAILGEWSIRAAKLERALEVERMSNMELHNRISPKKHQQSTSQTSPT